MARKPLKGNTEIVVRFRQFRSEKNRPLKVRDGLIEATVLLAGRAPVDPRLDEIRLDREGPLKARDRFFEALLCSKNHAQSRMLFRLFGVERARAVTTAP